jgi:hypothetical protein
MSFRPKTLELVFVASHIFKACKYSQGEIQYSQRHIMINHCDRRITLLSDTDISFVLFNISSKFLLYLEYYLLSLKMHKKVSK